MSLCPMNYDDVLKMMQFGSVVENNCEFSLSQLISQNTLPEEANTFFELYIKDSNGDLIDVPVLITNLKDNSGATPNESPT